MIAQTSTTYDPQRAAAADPPSRHAALASAVAGIRVRRGRMAVEQILLAAAAILFPLGLIFILLGWEGAAHNGHTYAQIDYLISGGLFGLGLSVAGGFMYFGYWLSRQLAESRRQNALTVQALQRLEDLLDFAVNSRAASDGQLLGDGWAGDGRIREEQRGSAGRVGAGAERAVGAERAAGAERAVGTARGVGVERGVGAERAAGRGRTTESAVRRSSRRSGADSSSEADRPTGQVPAVGGGALFATPRGNLLHRAECPVVARRDDLKTVRPGTDGYGYCTMCNAGGPA